LKLGRTKIFWSYFQKSLSKLNGEKNIVGKFLSYKITAQKKTQNKSKILLKTSKTSKHHLLKTLHIKNQ
jgi:hypothetical protein